MKTPQAMPASSHGGRASRRGRGPRSPAFEAVTPARATERARPRSLGGRDQQVLAEPAEVDTTQDVRGLRGGDATLNLDAVHSRLIDADPRACGEHAARRRSRREEREFARVDLRLDAMRL